MGLGRTPSKLIARTRQDQWDDFPTALKKRAGLPPLNLGLCRTRPKSSDNNGICVSDTPTLIRDQTMYALYTGWIKKNPSCQWSNFLYRTTLRWTDREQSSTQLIEHGAFFISFAAQLRGCCLSIKMRLLYADFHRRSLSIFLLLSNVLTIELDILLLKELFVQFYGPPKKSLFYIHPVPSSSCIFKSLLTRLSSPACCRRNLKNPLPEACLSNSSSSFIF